MRKITTVLIILLLASCSTSTSSPQAESKFDNIINALDKSGRKLADSSNRYFNRLDRISRSVKEVKTKEVYIDQKIDLFLIDGNLRVNSGVMDIMRDDELLALIICELGHNHLGHYKNRFLNVSNGYETALEEPFSDSQNSSADAYTLKYFFDNKLDSQAVVNSAYKLAKLEEKSVLKGGDDSNFSVRLVNKNSRDRARALASMLQESKSNPSYLQGLIRTETPEVETAVNTPAKKVLKNESTPIKEIKTIDVPEKKTVIETKVSPNSKSASLNTKKKEVAEIPTPKSSGGWYLQISAEDNEGTASNKVQELSTAGLRARIQETTVDGKKFYRVLVGPYKEKADLSEARKSNLVRSDSFPRYVD